MENKTYTLVDTEKKQTLNPRETYMKEHFWEFMKVCLGYGIIYTVLSYETEAGLGDLIYAVTSVAAMFYYFRKMNNSIQKETKLYGVGIALCGLSTCMTANEGFHFFNWCCMVGLFVLMVFSQFYQENDWDFIRYLKNGCYLLVTTLGFLWLPVKETRKNLKKDSGEEKKNLKLILPGIIAAASVLVVILPLLISSDKIVSQMFEEVLQIFALDKLWETLENIFWYLVAFVWAVVTMYAFFYACSRAEFSLKPERKLKGISSVTGITFTAILSVVYVFYSGIQIVYLFLRVGLPEGITYSEYAHEGFWQLVFVTILNVCMVRICNAVFEENKWLKGLLSTISGCTFIMIGSAAKRILLYIGVYHLTLLRVLVVWSLIVLTIVMVGVVLSIYRKEFPFVKYCIYVVVSAYLILSLSRPDSWIATYNVSHMETVNWENLYYLTENLSTDAASAIYEMDMEKFSDERMEADLNFYYERLLEEEKSMNIRSLNYSKIKAGKLAKEYLGRGTVQ